MYKIFNLLMLCILMVTCMHAEAIAYEAKFPLVNFIIIIKDAKIFFASRGEVAALRLDSGEVLWKTRFPEGVGAGPAMIDDILVIAVGSATHIIKAIDAKNGKILWTKKHRSFKIFPGERTVYLQVQGGNQLLAVDPWTGEDIWTSRGSDFGRVGYAIEKNALIFTDRGGILNAENGELVKSWSEELPSVRHLISDGGRIYGSYEDLVIAADAKTGEMLWSKRIFEGMEIDELLVAGKHLYIAAYDDSNPHDAKKGVIGAYDLSKDKISWSLPLSSHKGLEPDPMSISGGRLYLLMRDEESKNKIMALDLETGMVEWSYHSSKNLVGPAVPFDDFLFVSTVDDRLIALKNSNGEVVWTYQAVPWIHPEDLINERTGR